MAIVRLQDNELIDIANAIRAKLGVTTTYLPEEMAPAILSISEEKVFEWGSETEPGAGTANWWADLKAWVENKATISELIDCVGKTKSVTLTTSVLGTTTHLVRCIGYNCNRDKNNPTKNTLTFETANTLSVLTTFSSSNNKWTGSKVRLECIKYYDAFPGKASIVTVTIGTTTTVSNNQNGTPTYTDETVFLASDAEHGFLAGKDYKTGKGYASSYDEFDRYNTSKTPYQYCTSDANRIKNFKDNGSVERYWERSLSYKAETRACFIDTDGGPNDAPSNNFYGFAPCFAI